MTFARRGRFLDPFNHFAETVGQSNHAALKLGHNREVDEKTLRVA